MVKDPHLASYSPGKSDGRDRARKSVSRPRRSHKSEEGFALLEVVLAIGIMAAMMASTTALVITATNVAGKSRLRQMATDIASSTLDCAVASLNVGAPNFPTGCGEPTTLLNQLGFTGVGGVPQLYPAATPASTVSRGGTTFTVEQEVQAGNGSCGIPVGGAPPELQVTDWVTWANGVTPAMDWWDLPAYDTRQVDETTIVAVPAIALNPNDGSIKVAVTDDALNGQPGLKVIATNTATNQTTTAYTTDLGCALFLNMTPGPYAVSVQSVTGTYIDSNNDLAGGAPAILSGANMTGNVQSGGTLTLPTASPSYYTQAAYVQANYSVPQPEGLTWQQPYVTTAGDLSLNYPLSFYNSEANGLITNPSVAVPPNASGVPVFPFQLSSPSYHVMAGSCGTDNSPDGTTAGVPNDSVAVPSSGSLSGGSTVTAGFTLTPLPVVVTSAGGELNGATVVARPTAPGSPLTSPPSGVADGSCPGAGSTAMPALTLGTTGAASSPVPGGSTSVTVTSSANPSVAGTQLSLTATVSTVAPAIGTPSSGTVSFYQAGSPATLLGTAPVASGTATLSSVTTLPVGADNIYATFSLGGAYLSSTSSSTPLVENVTASGAGYATNVSTPVSSANPSVTANPVTFAVNVTSSPAEGSPTTGTVQFNKGGVAFGAAVPVNNGVATSAPVSLTHVGSPYSITAVYTPGADDNFAGSTSASLSQVVNASPPTSNSTTSATVTSSASPVTSGQSVTFTEQVTSAAGIPSGTVQFQDNGVNIGGPQTLQNGVATYITTLSAPPYAHAITAAFTSGDPNYGNSSTVAAFTQAVVAHDLLSSLPAGYFILWASSSDGTKLSTNTATAVLVQVTSSQDYVSTCSGGTYPSGYYYSGGACSNWSALASGALVRVPVS